jgi:hypothetical protein
VRSNLLILLRTRAERFIATSVPVYQTSRCHGREDSSILSHLHDNLMSGTQHTHITYLFFRPCGSHGCDVKSVLFFAMLERTKLVRRPRRKRKDDIEVGLETGRRFDVAQDAIEWQDLVNSAVCLQIPKKKAIFLASCLSFYCIQLVLQSWNVSLSVICIHCNHRYNLAVMGWSVLTLCKAAVSAEMNWQMKWNVSRRV